MLVYLWAVFVFVFFFPTAKMPDWFFYILLISSCRTEFSRSVPTFSEQWNINFMITHCMHKDCNRAVTTPVFHRCILKVALSNHIKWQVEHIMHKLFYGLQNIHPTNNSLSNHLASLMAISFSWWSYITTWFFTKVIRREYEIKTWFFSSNHLQSILRSLIHSVLVEHNTFQDSVTWLHDWVLLLTEKYFAHLILHTQTLSENKGLFWLPSIFWHPLLAAESFCLNLF